MYSCHSLTSANERHVLFLVSHSLSQEQTLKLVNIAHSTEDESCSGVVIPKAHCLLVTGLCHCESKWLSLVSAWLQQASENGEMRCNLLSRNTKY